MTVQFPVDPMLARAAPALPTGAALPGGCVYEPKFDGYRALVFTAGPGVRVQSRGQTDITAGFPDIVAAVTAQVGADVVLDGELVIWGDGRLDFPALNRRLAARPRVQHLVEAQPATFMVFDLLAVNGTDLTGRPFAERRRLLEELLADAAPPLQLVPQSSDPQVAAGWLEQYRGTHVGLEGVVVKGRTQRYLPGQRGWVKVRVRDTHDVVVGAVTGAASRPVRLVLGAHDPRGVLWVVGSTGPLAAPARRQVGALLVPAAGAHPWPGELSEALLGRFGSREKVLVVRVEPRLVVEVSADTAFEHGRWRHQTRFVRVRGDVDPSTVQPPRIAGTGQEP